MHDPDNTNLENTEAEETVDHSQAVGALGGRTRAELLW